MDNDDRLPARDTTRTPMDEASAVLSEMKNALRAAGQYPGQFTEAGIEWSDKHQAYVAVIRRVVKPDQTS